MLLLLVLLQKRHVKRLCRRNVLLLVSVLSVRQKSRKLLLRLHRKRLRLVLLLRRLVPTRWRVRLRRNRCGCRRRKADADRERAAREAEAARASAAESNDMLSSSDRAITGNFANNRGTIANAIVGSDS